MQQKKKKVDFSDVLRKGKDTYTAGKEFEGKVGFSRVPDDTYKAEFVEAVTNCTDDDKVFFERKHVIIEGAYKGETIRDALFINSDFGAGKFRDWLKKVRDEENPDDPADLQEIVDNLHNTHPYVCEIKITTNKKDNTKFNADVLELETSGDKKEETVEEEKPVKAQKNKAPKKDDKFDKVKALFIALDHEGVHKEEGRDEENLDDLILTISEYSYKEEQLTDEQIELLEELNLGDTIERKKVIAAKKKR